MAEKAVKPRKFEIPPNFIPEVLSSELCVEDLEDENTELWLFQTHPDIDLSKINQQELQLEGTGQCSYSSPTKVMNTVPRYFGEHDKDYYLVLPDKNGELQIASKKLHGHMLFTEVVEACEETNQLKEDSIIIPNDPRKDIRQRYFPFGGSVVTPKNGIQVQSTKKSKSKKTKKYDENSSDQQDLVVAVNSQLNQSESPKDMSKPKKKKRKSCSQQDSSIHLDGTLSSLNLVTKNSSEQQDVKIKCEIQSDAVNRQLYQCQSPEDIIKRKRKKRKSQNGNIHSSGTLSSAIIKDEAISS